ncbi:hypothetical protein KHS38_00045 [Mucilaginibacter sp. Bleaf8]|uniref:hypothetical protein n=1 Tax=Mucilaginibacter sp. Bleaf8 TaxID=2834430 RepID=UPI001BCF2029|nr:hypothetical protein [Mucilaginibacter sp. Bleaf8]MBS7562781.1 hypothetical protein [Mucilaginibacter sp. Bleaf8]
MIKLKPYFLLVALSSLLFGCKDFIEPSIKERQVMLNAPGNDYKSTSYTLNFWWNQVEDALQYRLQIVTPKFDSATVIVVDTVVKSDKFAFNLSPGTYQWRVRAENGSSETAYTTPQQFSVLFSSIKQQVVQVNTPGSNLLTTQSNLNFSWGELYGATKYRLQLDTNSFADETKLVLDQATPAQQFTYKLLKDQTYQWRVRAENDTAQSRWSVIRNLTFDSTPPGQVSLTAPAADQSVSSPVTMRWSQVATASKYRLYAFKADGTTRYNDSFPMLINTTSYTLTTGTFGERIYWKVTAIDAAGNEGTASTVRSFTLQ